MNYKRLTKSWRLILFIVCYVSYMTTEAAFSQTTDYKFAASETHPFGMINQKAPKELKDYAELIGTCNCLSYTKNQDGAWSDPVKMTWTFKYIMNGMAVQDETLKADGAHSGSIRQFHTDTKKWYVHYYSTSAPSTTLAAWNGDPREDEIVLYREQKAPNGTEGFYKIRFFDISEKGFNWLGAWTNTNESFTFETWKIECEKAKDDGF